MCQDPGSYLSCSTCLGLPSDDLPGYHMWSHVVYHMVCWVPHVPMYALRAHANKHRCKQCTAQLGSVLDSWRLDQAIDESFCSTCCPGQARPLMAILFRIWGYIGLIIPSQLPGDEAVLCVFSAVLIHHLLVTISMLRVIFKNVMMPWCINV